MVHAPTGTLYLACSTPAGRVEYTPYFEKFNASFAGNDYIATYNPTTHNIQRLTFENFSGSKGFSAHGMDVVPSAEDSTTLYVYLVNHRPSLSVNPQAVGLDSVIEVFKTKVGSTSLQHIKTVEDKVIDTPNDVVGAPDGKSFFFTNDHSAKVGLVRVLCF